MKKLMTKPINDFNQELDDNGRALTVCILHELDPNEKNGAQAVANIGNMSVCEDHLHRVSDALIRGYSVDGILKQVKMGKF